MTSSRHPAARFLRAFLLATPLLAQPIHAAPNLTALDRYVAEPDPAYAWKVLKQESGQGATITIIELTSQSWLKPDEVNRTVWKHQLNIIRPDKAAGRAALLFITGGSNRDTEPRKPDGMLLRIAQATGSVIAELRMVPNQPLIFHNDGKERVEDDLIAYSWVQYMKKADERWPARLPMTKSAVRAMDTVTAFLATADGGSQRVDQFVIAGGSKRGWTTWTTAAVDPRVIGIAPIVIDMLNVVPSFQHHFKAYGFWAPAVGDYVHHGVMNWMGSREFANLMTIEEPYEYRDRLTLPKLMINATGDQFFLPDSSQFFFADLKGPKYLRYIPNADHSLKDTDAPETLAAWHYSLINGLPLPRFTWTTEPGGAIRVRGVDAPKSVTLYQATNPTTRDFRLETLGKVWKGSPLPAQPDGTFLAQIDKPAQGWTAFFVELTYPVEGCPAPLKLTTHVKVLPDSLPHNEVKIDRLEGTR